jgi:hypothetical protein
MFKRRKNSSQKQAQGAALIELVIEHVQANPQTIAAFSGASPLVEPQPLPADVLAKLTFPNGKPLPPSLKRWLAFDYTRLATLGWLDLSTSALFTPRRYNEIIEAERKGWGRFCTELGNHFDTCFLLPGGPDSLRMYAVTGEPDLLGEYPILIVDMDYPPPATGIMYPGFDVYIADLAGIIDHPRDTHPQGAYVDLFDDPRYAPRLKWHADRLFKWMTELIMRRDLAAE